MRFPQPDEQVMFLYREPVCLTEGNEEGVIMVFEDKSLSVK
jgi:hypothetical protein